ncbi:MAG: T9SS type A sorting domain-containing protein [Bacteroidia bacterium]
MKINKTIIFPNSTSISYIGRRFSDGGIISVGLCTNNDLINNNDGYIMKADSLGNLLWQKSYRFTDGDFVEYFTDFIETSDGGILISGSAGESNANGGQNSWLIKLDANGCLDPQDCDVGVTDMPLPDALTIYPNPANEYLNLKIEQGSGTYTVFLLDAMGRLVQHETHSGIGTHTLQVGQLPAGVYFCTVHSANGDFMGTERIVIIQ